MSEKEQVQKTTSDADVSLDELKALFKSALEEVLAAAKKDQAAPKPKASDLIGERPVADEAELKRELARNVKLDKPTGGIAAARFVRTIAFAKHHSTTVKDAAKYLERVAWDDDLGKAVTKALLVQNFQSAGFLLPPAFADEVIGLLRSQTAVRRAGPRVVPMPRGTITYPRVTQGATATYVGETASIPVTDVKGDQIVLTAKKLAALVPLSNELLMVGSSNVDELVRDELIRAMAEREDQAFLRGDGTASTPKGLRNLFASGNEIAVNNSVTKEANLYNLVSAVANKKALGPRMAWFMHPRTKIALLKERDANGNLIFPELKERNILLGYPVYETHNIPINLGAGSDESEVIFANMDMCLLGETGELRVNTSQEGSYTDGATMQSAFQQDMTLIRMVAMHDFAVTHNEGVAVLTGVKWS